MKLLNSTAASDQQESTENTLETGVIVFITTLSCIAFMGFVGNSLILVVMGNKKFDKTSTSIYLCTLSLSDSVVLFTGPVVVNILANLGLDLRALNLSTCWILKFLIYWSRHMSSFCLMIITLERLIAIVKPHRAKDLMTKRSAYTVVITLALTFAVLNCHVFIMYQLDTEMENSTLAPCRVMNPSYITWDLNLIPYMDLFLYSMLPSSVIVISNTIIVYTLTRNKMKMIGNTGQTAAQKSIYKIVPMLLLVSTTFVICTLPLCIYILVRAILGIQHEGELTLGWALVSVPSTTNHSINFLLYLISGQQFRNQFLAIVCVKRREDSVVTQSSG